MTVSRSLKALAPLSVLLVAAPAVAAPTPDVVSTLVMDVCIPALQANNLDPARLPPGARVIAAADKPAYGLTAGTEGYLVDSDDDVVMLEVGQGCQVFAARGGARAWADVLDARLKAAYPDAALTGEASRPDDADLIMRVYRVRIPAGDHPAITETIAVTFPAEGAGRRSFSVAVLGPRR